MVSNYPFRDFYNSKTVEKEEKIVTFFIDFNRLFPKTYRSSVCYVISLSTDVSWVPKLQAQKSLFSMKDLACEAFKCGHVAVELNDYKLNEAKKWSSRVDCNKSALSRSEDLQGPPEPSLCLIAIKLNTLRRISPNSSGIDLISL